MVIVDFTQEKQVGNSFNETYNYTYEQKSQGHQDLELPVRLQGGLLIIGEWHNVENLRKGAWKSIG